MPYGRAWFLRLAVDYRREFGDGKLDPLADDIAASLITFYSNTPPTPLSIAYDSATWALINLYDYGSSRGDERIVNFVRKMVTDYYLTDRRCALQTTEVDTGEFMAICTNWAWLVQKVLPREEFIGWVNKFLPKSLPLAPIKRPATIHQVGLNFSRSWGFWNLYWGTDDARFITLYLDHFKQTFSDTQMWKGSYDTVSHWVPQFGMLALILTYYDWP